MLWCVCAGTLLTVLPRAVLCWAWLGWAVLGCAVYLCAQNANRMFGNFGELLDLHASHKIYGDASEEEEQLEEEEEVRCAVHGLPAPLLGGP